MQNNIIDINNPDGSVDSDKDTTTVAADNNAPDPNTPVIVSGPTTTPTNNNGADVDNKGTDKPTIPSTLPQEVHQPKTFAESCLYCKTKMILALAQDAAIVLVFLALSIYLLKTPKNA